MDGRGEEKKEIGEDSPLPEVVEAGQNFKEEVKAMFKQLIFYPGFSQELTVPPKPEEWRVVGDATAVRYTGETPLSEEFIAYARVYGWSYCFENKTFYPTESVF